MINETQIREVVDNVLSEEGLKNFIKIFEKEHNIFRGSHEKMAVPPVIVENYYNSEYLNERLWDIDGHNLYYDKGWVGIGKKPAFPFDVLGDVSLDGAAVFNESGLAKNFRIESLNDEYAFFLNAEDDLIGIMESLPTARVHINSLGGSVPALNLESGAEGELVTPDGQQLRIGHWNAETKTFTERMKMDDFGKIFISYLPTGSVAFAGAGGEIKHDGIDFYYNVDTHSLGIGAIPTNLLYVYGLGTISGWGGDYGGVVARFRCSENRHTSIVIDAKAGYDSVIGLSTGGSVKWSIRNDVGDPDSFEIRYSKDPENRTDFEITNVGAVNIPTGLTTVKDLAVTMPVNIYNLSHDLFADYVVAEHLSLPNTIVNVLSDHDKVAHDVLGLSHDSLADVSIDDHHAQIHAPAHQSGGGDAIKLDDLATPDDTVDLDATIVKHGLLMKLGGGEVNFLRADGTWADPVGTFSEWFKTITGITNDVIATGYDDVLTLSSANNRLTIVGTTATKTIAFTLVEANIDHDLLAGFVAAKHLSLPNTIANVLSNHTKAIHDALGINADLLDNQDGTYYLAWTNITGKPSTYPPSAHTLVSHSSKAHSELTGVSANQHHAQLHEASHRSGGGDALNHDLLAGFVAAEHKSLPNTIAQVLSDHDKAVHDALGLSHDSLSDVSANDHHNQLHAESHHSVGGDQLAFASINGFSTYLNQAVKTTSSPQFASVYLAANSYLQEMAVPHILRFTNQYGYAEIGVDVLGSCQITTDADVIILGKQTACTKIGDSSLAVYLSTGKLVFNGGYYLGSAGLVANNKVADSAKLGGVAAASYALATRKLDDFGAPDDNTDLNALTTRHGLLPKLGGGTTNFLRADGTWAEPSGGVSVHSRAPVNLSHTDDNTWRDVDVTAYTSASATFVLLNLHCSADDGGTYTVTLETREKGETYSNGRVGATSTEDLFVQDNSFVICKLDAGQVFQYKCQVSNALHTNAIISVIGWIE